MRVVFYSYGTRGDAQPPVVLASALRDRGYAVRVAAPENLRSFVERAGVEYAPLFGNSQEILESEDGRKMLASGNVRAFTKQMGEIARRINVDLFRTAGAAAEDADAIVGGSLAHDISFTLAEKRGVPFVDLQTIPFETTGQYPCPFVFPRPLPFGFLNRLTYALYRKLAWDVNRETLNSFRSSLGLLPLRTSVIARAHEHGCPVLQLCSESVLPRPRDLAPNVAVTGYVRMPPSIRSRIGEAAPPPGLVDWLAKGPPPIYLGFGSMPVLDPAGLAKQALAVAHALDQRIIVSAGWTNLESVQHMEDSRVSFTGGIDHGWLLPQCAAAVHHGGAGTTAASLEAGVPTVVCSVFADQPFWGERCIRLGVGTHIPFAKLSAKTLEDALRRVLVESVRERARVLGEQLRKEDGTAAAAQALVARFEQKGVEQRAA